MTYYMAYTTYCANCGTHDDEVYMTYTKAGGEDIKPFCNKKCIDEWKVKNDKE